MTYELAKQLKNAGFPKESFVFKEGIYNSPSRKDYYVISPRYENEPSLSELIESCPNFHQLTKVEFDGIMRWFCYAGSKNGPKQGIGETMEEAVARLWLELNKK